MCGQRERDSACAPVVGANVLSTSYFPRGCCGLDRPGNHNAAGLCVQPTRANMRGLCKHAEGGGSHLIHVVPQHLLGVQAFLPEDLVVDLAQLLVVHNRSRFVLSEKNVPRERVRSSSARLERMTASDETDSDGHEAPAFDRQLTKTFSISPKGDTSRESTQSEVTA